MREYQQRHRNDAERQDDQEWMGEDDGLETITQRFQRVFGRVVQELEVHARRVRRSVRRHADELLA